MEFLFLNSRFLLLIQIADISKCNDKIKPLRLIGVFVAYKVINPKKSLHALLRHTIPIHVRGTSLLHCIDGCRRKLFCQTTGFLTHFRDYRFIFSIQTEILLSIPCSHHSFCQV
ncbi:hypothetical protein DdX_09894 [Ditylenchus destructor]|uniref:Uncharacterized protein n=1 Tax=Ditylenchus destructor TaxID=166010 RepID=A0AAD4R618_9BILA|nr:hypothetical protein DdX_09894 [Ditylenchus destructor]